MVNWIPFVVIIQALAIARRFMQRSASAYGWLMLLGISISLAFWVRMARRDSRLLGVYAGALAGAMVGAKIVFLLAEGWLYVDREDRWELLLTGKSILGALLGGYAGVEIAKRFLGYRSATGDLFAVVAPVGIMLGRIGCILHGCCLGNVCTIASLAVPDAHGVLRWPAAHAEFAFNLLMFAILVLFRWKGWLSGQLFHIYLMAYGSFRIAHEYFRDTPRLLFGITGYQIAALLVFALGSGGFWLRAKGRMSRRSPIAETLR
jgi:phosphatidylglycerol---prolipoprotein diacylglyceryl transferase